MNLKSDNPVPKRSSLASTKADLRELKGNSQATVQELQAFLHELKGKSPQEMLGVVAASGLVRSLALSTALVLGGILLFTAIPFFFGEEKAPVAEKTIPAEPAPPPATPDAPPEPAATAPETAPDPISSLGVDEKLQAPPDQNPLENKGDDFLKDLE